MIPALIAETATLSGGSTIELALAILGGTGLLALGSWSAILRHRQDDHGLKLAALALVVEVLESDRVAREAISRYKKALRRDADAPRSRPPESSV